MAPDRQGTARELAIRAIERGEGHEKVCDDRWAQLRADRADEAEETARWRIEQRERTAEIYRKLDDLAEGLGNVEKAAAGAPAKWAKWALSLAGALIAVLLAAIGYGFDKFIVKGGAP